MRKVSGWGLGEHMEAAGADSEVLGIVLRGGDHRSAKCHLLNPTTEPGKEVRPGLASHIFRVKVDAATQNKDVGVVAQVVQSSKNCITISKIGASTAGAYASVALGNWFQF